MKQNQKNQIDPLSPQARLTDDKTPFRLLIDWDDQPYLDFVWVADDSDDTGCWYCPTCGNEMEAESRAYIIASYPHSWECLIPMAKEESSKLE